MQEANYKIPTIEELLTDGFKYEVKTATKGQGNGRVVIFDFSTNEETVLSEMITPEDKWEERIKQTLDGPWEITDSEGIHWSGTYLNSFDNPYQQRDYLQKLLDEGRIRCKADQ
jgi:hypothetical protein